jgi:hypothetical protein
MDIANPIGSIPHRLALAGGWIDQPFVSRLNPAPPGSMVVVGLQPLMPVMDRCGMASGTRKVAQRLWGGELPRRDASALTRELYFAENSGKAEPSGSQDMIGLIYPGVCRLDYAFDHEGGRFPAHIEQTSDPSVVRWIEDVLYLLPIAQRPAGYNPLGVRRLDAGWIRRLGQSGKDCFTSLVERDLRGLGASMNECMQCWEAILPHTVQHPTLQIDLKAILCYYQARYPGAMYSGCGGGYLFVASDEPVPGGFRIRVRTE